MNKEKFKELLKMNKIPNPKILEMNKVINPKSIKDLPLNEWVIINSSKIGIVTCFRVLNGVYVEFSRVYSSDYAFYDEEYFNKWRERIEDE